MADRSKLDFNFIDLVMSVSGRVRPVDLQQIPEQNRAALLQAYYQQRSATTPLYFDGDVLVQGPGAGTPPPSAEPAPAAYAPGENPYESVGGPAAPLPAVPNNDIFPANAAAGVAAAGVAAAGVAAANGPAAPGAAPAPMPVPVTPPGPGEPAPSQVPDIGDSDFFAVPLTLAPSDGVATDAPPSEAAPSAPVPGWLEGEAGQPGFEEPFVPGFEPEPGIEPAAPSGSVSFLFWLLPVFLGFIGGIIAFFVVRKKNPKLALVMLITGIVLTLIAVALGVGAIFLMPHTGAAVN